MAKFERKSAEDRREAILVAALPLFATKGFDATTTREIARAANVSDALLYKYFPSKVTIYGELIAYCSDRSEVIGARLETLEKTAAAFVRSIYFLMYVVRFGDPRINAYKGFMDRLLVQDLLNEGIMFRDFHHNKLIPWIEKLNDIYAAVIHAGDAHADGGSTINSIWFTQQLAYILVVLDLPKQHPIKFRGHERKVFDDVVLFALRGLGLKETVIKKNYDPDQLYEFVQNMFNELPVTART